jgi:hypothetical protein
MLVSLLATAALFQAPAAPSVEVVPTKPSFTVGSQVRARVTLSFAEGLHAYQNPPTKDYQIPLTVNAGDDSFRIIKVYYPKGSDFQMAGEDEPSKVYEGQIQVTVVARPKRAKAGKVTLPLSIDVQQCNAEACFPPEVVKASTEVQIVEKG